MKIRDLKHGHEGFPRVHAWPPIWMPGGRVSAPYVADIQFVERAVLIAVILGIAGLVGWRLLRSRRRP